MGQIERERNGEPVGWSKGEKCDGWMNGLMSSSRSPTLLLQYKFSEHKLRCHPYVDLPLTIPYTNSTHLKANEPKKGNGETE